MARDHRVVGPDRAVHGAAEPDLGGVEIEGSLDALCIAPEEPGHVGKKVSQTGWIHKFATGDHTGMLSGRPCVASSASMGMTRQQISPTSACTRFSTGARSPRDWRL